MKIDGIDPAKGLPSAKPAGKDPVSGASFASLYNNLISKTGASDPSPTSASPLPGAGLPFMAPPVSGPDLSIGSMTVDRMESLLTDLDMFKNALANSDIPVDRLAPLVSEFVGRKDELAVMIGRIPDQQLKSVVSDALNVVIDVVNQYHTGYAA